MEKKRECPVSVWFVLVRLPTCAKTICAQFVRIVMAQVGSDAEKPNHKSMVFNKRLAWASATMHILDLEVRPAFPSALLR